MKNCIYIIILLFGFNAFAQEHAWVFFIDKPNSASYFANPLTMLSQRAIDRRVRQNIAYDSKDIPINTAYINQTDAVTGIEVKAKSKWLNAIHVIGLEQDIRDLENFSFVDHVEFASNLITRSSTSNNGENTVFDETVTYNYGGSFNQVSQIGVDFLHQNDFTGQGIQIAVLDAGFGGVDTFSAFQRIRDNNQILGSYNFVERNQNLNTASTHGMSVLSTIVGYVDNELIGTAVDASVYLFVTEDAINETPLEESLWVEAAEKADSLGVDIINTSLGYQDFDEAKYDHAYSDFNGSTTFIARGASILASRGIVLTVSAGNDGNGFHYIGTPADATDVLTVGSVDEFGNMSDFSSYGPSADNRIKPDVVAKGQLATIVNSSGNVGLSNGTSFSSPIMCGAVASLWQAFPDKTSYEIMQMIRESAHLYNAPEDHFGYGIPNFQNVYTTAKIDDNTALEQLLIFPNPITDILYISSLNNKEIKTILLYNNIGSLILNKNIQNTGLEYINTKNINTGLYYAKVVFADNSFAIKKIVKQ